MFISIKKILSLSVLVLVMAPYSTHAMRKESDTPKKEKTVAFQSGNKQISANKTISNKDPNSYEARLIGVMDAESAYLEAASRGNEEAAFEELQMSLNKLISGFDALKHLSEASDQYKEMHEDLHFCMSYFYNHLNYTAIFENTPTINNAIRLIDQFFDAKDRENTIKAMDAAFKALEEYYKKCGKPF